MESEGPQDDVETPTPPDIPEHLPGDNLTLREFVSSYSLRLVALFLQASFAAIASGAIIGVAWYKAIAMAGFMGLATVGKFVFRNMARTGKISRRDLDVALALASSDVDTNYNMTSQGTYYNLT